MDRGAMKIIYKTLKEKMDVPMSIEELSDLGVELHNLDIRTGENSSSVKSHFLPRIAFPELQNSTTLSDFPLLEDGSSFEEPGSANMGDTFENWFKGFFNESIINDFMHHALHGEKRAKKRFQQGYPQDGWVQKPTCGPGSEIFHLATQFRTEMEEDIGASSRSSRAHECYFTFPHLTIMTDDFARWRVFQSYFDGSFHVSFTDVLDLEHLLVQPQEGKGYFDSVDRADYVKKTNVLLKWAWPLTQGNGVIADHLLDKEDSWEIFMSCLVSR